MRLNRRLTCVLNLYALLLVVASGCKPKASKYEPPAAPAVVVFTTEWSDAPTVVHRGTVAAGARYRLGFQVPGVLATLCCRTGDKVRQGQLLATLRAGDADARLRAATAARSKALRDQELTTHLVKGGALAPNVDKEARDQLTIAEAQAALADEALRYTRLTAPVAGTVQQRFAEPGEAIGPGTPVLLIEQVGKLVVRVGVLQEELPGIVPGAAVTLTLDGVAQPMAGVISNVAPVPEVTDGLFTVEINPKPPADVKLLPGSLVSVEFKGAQQQKTVKIPNDSLVERNGAQGVLLIDGDDQAPRAKFQPISISKRLGKDVWVKQGLSSGQRIIAEGAYFIEDGERLAPITHAAALHD